MAIPMPPPQKKLKLTDNAGGYECDFVDIPHPNDYCATCLLPARDPQQTRCECAKLYCKSCYDKQRSTAETCPTCHQPLDAFPDVNISRRIRSLKVKCTSRNCLWVDELGLLEGHLKTCEHALVPCSNGCGCNISFARQQHHVTKKCPFRKHICKHCKMEGIYKDMIKAKSIHWLQCPGKMAPCPNNGCKVKVLRKEMNEHRSICPKTTISCPYIYTGCTFRSLREQMDDHIPLHHVHAMKEIDTLKKLQGQVVHNVCRMPHFQQLKESNQSWFSPGFYTHTSGYMMCLRVDANGHGDGDGTNVSVYLYIMKGTNDDNLIWPLKCKCSITLLNQLNDEDHHTVNFECGSDDDAYSRVTEGTMGSGGYGVPQFIAHDKLDFQGQSQYLMEDCLYIKVEIEVLNSCKPWLTATVQ